MPDRATVSQVAQIGVETTPGTAAAANRSFRDLSITLGAPDASAEMFRPDGRKVPTVAIPGPESMAFGIQGKVGYTSLVYPLLSLLGTVTSAADGTNGKKWVFPLFGTSPKTWTIEMGDGVRAHRATYGLVREMSFELGKRVANLTGGGVTRALEDGVTMTATPTEVASEVVIPKNFDFYLDDPATGIGTTKLTRAIRATPRIADRYAAAWFVDSTQQSYAAHVETPIAGECTLLLEADASGMAPLTTFRAGATKLFRAVAVGDVIAGATASAYKFQVDLALKINDVSGFSDEDGVYATGYACSIVDEVVRTGGPKGGEITLINMLAAA